MKSRDFNFKAIVISLWVASAAGPQAHATSCRVAIGRGAAVRAEIPAAAKLISQMPDSYFWSLYLHLPKSWQHLLAEAPRDASEFDRFFHRNFGKYLEKNNILDHLRRKLLAQLQSGGETLDTWIPKQIEAHTKKVSPEDAAGIELWLAEFRNYIRAINGFENAYYVEIQPSQLLDFDFSPAGFKIGNETFEGHRMRNEIHLTIDRSKVRIPDPESIDRQHALGFLVDPPSRGLKEVNRHSAMIGLDGMFYLMGHQRDHFLELPEKVKISLALPLRTMTLQSHIAIVLHGRERLPAHEDLIKLDLGRIPPQDLLSTPFLQHSIVFQDKDFVRPKRPDSER